MDTSKPAEQRGALRPLTTPAWWPRARRWIVEWSFDHPWVVLAAALILTLVFGSQLPRITTDTDPKNMLPITSPVRRDNDQVEGWFGLHRDRPVLDTVPRSAADAERLRRQVLDNALLVNRLVSADGTLLAPSASSGRTSTCRSRSSRPCRSGSPSTSPFTS